MQLFKKKVKSNLRFTEIRANIIDMDNNTFNRVFIENVTDKVFIIDGKIYTILPEYIQPCKYDSELEILHGLDKIKRMFKSKKIGLLWFINDKNVLVENNRYLPKSKYEMIKEYVGYVKCNALLFKAWTESMDYKNAIRSLPNSKIMFNWKGKGKWIILAGVMGVIAIVIMLLTKIITIPGVNL